MLKHVETPLKPHSFDAKPTFLVFFSREAAVRRFAKSLTVLEECSGSGATLSRGIMGNLPICGNEIANCCGKIWKNVKNGPLVLGTHG
jgi:hypothetical protein